MTDARPPSAADGAIHDVLTEARALLLRAQSPVDREGYVRVRKADFETLATALGAIPPAPHPPLPDAEREALAKLVAMFERATRAEAALADMTAQRDAAVARVVGLDRIAQAAWEFRAFEQTEPEKDCWDTESGEEKPGATKFASDWAHHDWGNERLRLRGELDAALAALAASDEAQRAEGGR